jgi:hypothetical protein
MLNFMNGRLKMGGWVGKLGRGRDQRMRGGGDVLLHSLEFCLLAFTQLELVSRQHLHLSCL